MDLCVCVFVRCVRNWIIFIELFRLFCYSPLLKRLSILSLIYKLVDQRTVVILYAIPYTIYRCTVVLHTMLMSTVYVRYSVQLGSKTTLLPFRGLANSLKQHAEKNCVDVGYIHETKFPIQKYRKGKNHLSPEWGHLIDLHTLHVLNRLIRRRQYLREKTQISTQHLRPWDMRQKAIKQLCLWSHWSLENFKYIVASTSADSGRISNTICHWWWNILIL